MAHVLLIGSEDPIIVSNIYGIGRNYVRHIEELGNVVEEQPVVFMKPTSALISEGQNIELPEWSADIHHETELVILIGREGRHIPESTALTHVRGYGIGLDLTARDTQSTLKAKGLPWTRAKGFATSACVSRFVPASDVPHPQRLAFSLDVNGVRRQIGDTSLMLFSVARLVAELSSLVPLVAGDLIFTGTPEGVARLQSGDHLLLDLHGLVSARFLVA